MTKAEADKRADNFANELTVLAREREMTLAYVVMHNIEDGYVQSGIANSEDVDDDMRYVVAGFCKCFCQYMMKHGKTADEAAREIGIWEQSGIAAAINEGVSY